MGNGSLPGVKRPGRGADYPPPSKCRGHEGVGLYLYSPSGPSWPVIGGNFTFMYSVDGILGTRASSLSYVVCELDACGSAEVEKGVCVNKVRKFLVIMKNEKFL